MMTSSSGLSVNQLKWLKNFVGLTFKPRGKISQHTGKTNKMCSNNCQQEKKQRRVKEFSSLLMMFRNYCSVVWCEELPLNSLLIEVITFIVNTEM